MLKALFFPVEKNTCAEVLKVETCWQATRNEVVSRGDSMKYWNFMEDLLLNCNHKLFNVFDCVNFGFQQAQLLEEMDEEFGISDLMEEEFRSLSKSKKPVCS